MRFILSVGLFFSLQSHALTNSVVATDEKHRSIALLGTMVYDAEGSEFLGFCNATFVQRNLLVTAAHCVQDAIKLGNNSVKIQLGYYKYIDRQGEKVLIGYVTDFKQELTGEFVVSESVRQQILRQRQRVQISAAQDIALVRLSESIPETIVLPLTKIISVRDFNLVRRSPTSYRPQIITWNLFRMEDSDNKRMALLNRVNYSGGAFESQSVARVEEGDSGAPLEVSISEENQIIGVVKGRAESWGRNWDSYTAVHPFICQWPSYFAPEVFTPMCAGSLDIFVDEELD